MRVTVIAEDSDKGTCLSITSCAFALAFLRANPNLLPYQISTTNERTKVYYHDGTRRYFWHPLELREAIDDFDANRTPIPAGEYELKMSVFDVDPFVR